MLIRSLTSPVPSSGLREDVEVPVRPDGDATILPGDVRHLGKGREALDPDLHAGERHGLFRGVSLKAASERATSSDVRSSEAPPRIGCRVAVVIGTAKPEIAVAVRHPTRTGVLDVQPQRRDRLEVVSRRIRTAVLRPDGLADGRHVAVAVHVDPPHTIRIEAPLALVAAPECEVGVIVSKRRTWPYVDLRPLGLGVDEVSHPVGFGTTALHGVVGDAVVVERLHVLALVRLHQIAGADERVAVPDLVGEVETGHDPLDGRVHHDHLGRRRAPRNVQVREPQPDHQHGHPPQLRELQLHRTTSTAYAPRAKAYEGEKNTTRLP